jgi:hypothetical protein
MKLFRVVACSGAAVGLKIRKARVHGAMKASGAQERCWLLAAVRVVGTYQNVQGFK